MAEEISKRLAPLKNCHRLYLRGGMGRGPTGTRRLKEVLDLLYAWLLTPPYSNGMAIKKLLTFNGGLMKNQSLLELHNFFLRVSSSPVSHGYKLLALGVMQNGCAIPGAVAIDKGRMAVEVGGDRVTVQITLGDMCKYHWEYKGDQSEI